MKNTALQANSSDDMTKMQVSLDNYSLNLEIHLYKLGHIKFKKLSLKCYHIVCLKISYA